MRKSLLLMVLLCGTLPAQAQKSRALVIRDVTVIDCTGAKPQAGMTVVIARGRIAEVGKVAEVKTPKGAQVVEGKGKFLIPGLWDMHVHLTDAGEGAVAQLIENGVTGVRDMGGDLALVQRLRREIEQGKRVGPHIVAAGAMVDGPTEAKWHMVAKNEAEARELVRSLKTQGADFVKIHTNQGIWGCGEAVDAPP